MFAPLPRRLLFFLFASTLSLVTLAEPSPSFVAFESGPVRPIAISPNGKKLFVTNIADNRLEILDLSSGRPVPQASVNVGLEPVAVAALNNTTVFVVNHLSDSVSVVDLRGVPQVVKTLLVGDEPRDIVIADPDGNGPLSPRVFITTAHRGQHRTDPSIAHVPGAGDPQLATPGVGRADVWVFDTAALGSAMGGVPLKIMTFFTDTPRALAVSPDQKKVYVASHFSQNQTALVGAGVACKGFQHAAPCTTRENFTAPDGLPGAFLPGGNPGPSTNFQGIEAPEVGIIVKWNNATGAFEDEVGRNWNNGVHNRLPDKDVFTVDVATLNETAHHRGVGTTLFNMVVNPVSGALYVSNSEAMNMTRFEGPGRYVSKTSAKAPGVPATVQGHLAEMRITVIPSPDIGGTAVNPRHLNKHIDYRVLKAPASVRNKSLATPTDMVIAPDGKTLYVAAFGSQAIGVFDVARLENDTFVPNAADHIKLSGGGPGGLVLSADAKRLYVYTRFNNSVSVIDTKTAVEIGRVALFNPEPQKIVRGRPFLYDARISSSNGEAACASCHIFGDADNLAWDLGDPDAPTTANPIPRNLGELVKAVKAFTPEQAKNPANLQTALGLMRRLLVLKLDELNGGAGVDGFHPMKGPMTTQSLRGLTETGALHWRGDRATGVFNKDPEHPTLDDAFDTDLSFRNFTVAFDGLQGRNGQLDPQDMRAFTDFQLSVFIPPNPIRNLDNSLTESQEKGQRIFFGYEETVGKGENQQTIIHRVDGFSMINEKILNSVLPGPPVTAGFFCGGCHIFDLQAGHYGTKGRQAFDRESQAFKVPHLRHVYKKVGAFGMSDAGFGEGAGEVNPFVFRGDQIKNFGILHDGGVDTIQNFMRRITFRNVGIGVGLQSEQEREWVESFVLAFPSDLAPIVGQQMTVDREHLQGLPRVKLLLERADSPFHSKALGGQVTEADVVVKGVVSGRQTGWLYLSRRFVDQNGVANQTAQRHTEGLSPERGLGMFLSDRGDKRPVSLSDLLRIADGPLTFTAVPPGSGRRIGIDRNLNGVLDGRERSVTRGH